MPDSDSIFRAPSNQGFPDLHLGRAPAPAVYCGIQHGAGIHPDIELWTLTAPVGEHPTGSTLARATIERHGFALPTIVTRAEHLISA